MVKLDRVEMLRNEGSEHEHSVALQKQMQTQAVREALSNASAEECREEAAPVEDSRDDVREEEEEFIEAEFETVLQPDFSLNKDEPVAASSPRSEAAARESVRSERILAPMDDEVSQYGVEVEYRRMKSPIAEAMEHPSLSASEGTWSFDTNLHRRKQTKPAIAQNVFPGFTEEDEINVESEDIAEKEDIAPVAEEAEEVEEVVEETPEEQPEEETSEEQPTETEEIATEESEPIAEEQAVVSEDSEGAMDSQSMEFDAVLEKIAEHIENSDWDAFVAEVTARPSMATLSSVDFFPSECTGFLAAGASENLLLHEVCKNEPTVEAVITLLEVHDAAVKTAGQWGYLPIHCACASGASEGVIKALLKAHPESIHAFGDDLMYPLHLACKRGAPMELFKFLIEEHREACTAKDVYDKTPMDYVMTHPEGYERAQKIEILGHNIQAMYLSTTEIESKLRETEEKTSSIRKELIEKREKVAILEKDLKEMQGKTLSLEGDLKEKNDRTSGLGEQLKESQEKVVELEEQLGVERAKASVFGENLKKELSKTNNLESELRRERARSSQLATELQTNADEWTALGAEMEVEFKKSSEQLTKERRKIVQLEKKLKAEQQQRALYEDRMYQQLQEMSSIDGPAKQEAQNEMQKVSAIQEKLAEAKLQWLLEKQEIYERDDKNLAEAYMLLQESMSEDEPSDETPDASQLKEEWLLKRNEIIEKNDAQMAAAYKVVEEIESELSEKHASSLFERQAIYERVGSELTEAYKIICQMEIEMKQERTNWLMERQNILERNDENMAQAFMVMRDTEMTLAAKKLKLQEYEKTLDKREKEIKIEHTKSKTLLHQLEMAKAISNEKLAGLVDELNLQKSFSECQSKQIEAIESSISLNLSDVNAFAKEQEERLAYEKSLADSIMEKIVEKKKLMRENQEMTIVLEKSNLIKQELLEAQQKKVELLEAGRREKEAKLQLNQEAMKQLKESIAEMQALEKEESAEAKKLAGSRASRKTGIEIEREQIKELDFTLARKQALIELEKMKEKTLQQTIAQKHELIETEVARIKELEELIAEKEKKLAEERKTIKELKVANAEKDELIATEKEAIVEIRKTQEEKQKALEAQLEKEAELESHLKKEEEILAARQAAVDGVKEARETMESELQIQKDTTVALEHQITRKKYLISKEEYVAKCLQHLSMHKREFMPPGAISYMVNAYFGVEYKVVSSRDFLLRETHLASNFIKTQVRENYLAVQRRRDESIAMVTGAICRRRDLVTAAVRKTRDDTTAAIRKRRDDTTAAIRKTRDDTAAAIRKRRDDALAMVPSMPKMPTVSVPSIGPRSLVARLKSFGVNVDLFPKGYGVTDPKEDQAPTGASVEKKIPESKLPKWTKKESE